VGNLPVNSSGQAFRSEDDRRTRSSRKVGGRFSLRFVVPASQADVCQERTHTESFEMKIATKLGLLFAGMIVVFVLLGGVLLAQLRMVSSGYDAVLASPIHDMDAARVVQVNFKKEVQEWKDTLLRGHNAKDLAKYSKQFHEKEATVRSGAISLASSVQDEGAHNLLVKFVAADDVMSAKYHRAYAVYVAGNADFKAADTLVRGQDREPTDLFDKVVARLQARVQTTIAAQQSSVRQNEAVALGIACGLLLLLGVLGFLTVRSIVQRLASLHAVSDRLSRADVAGLSIDISGKDEIGEFGESMKGVHAAIEELLHMAQAPARAA
jgi:methyl-accepting chemotaxis protein